MRNSPIRRLVRDKGALALPITFLILFVTTIGIVSVTYYFAIEKINSQSQTLKVSTAKQNFLSLNEVILSTLWQPGTSGTLDLADSGGTTKITPLSDVLTIRIDYESIQETIFNSPIGKVTYELPYSSSSETGLYLAGDGRTITNQTGASTSQLYITNGAQHPEIRLRYRPLVSCTSAGFENGKAVNNIRIYIVNLNSSSSIKSQGELPMKISCLDTLLTTKTYQGSSSLDNLTITASLDSDNGSVSIPICSTPQGAVIHIETVISNVSVQRWIR